MKLQDYKEYKGLTYDELSDQVGVERSTVYRICKEVYCVRLNDAYKITRNTQGYVRLEDLLPLEGDC
jgi:DNA-binding XRE family transcriptional regulator